MCDGERPLQLTEFYSQQNKVYTEKRCRLEEPKFSLNQKVQYSLPHASEAYDMELWDAYGELYGGGSEADCHIHSDLWCLCGP